jgi:1-acyl-sn-glycerol-3-phosphate acyltransferase
VDAVMGLIGSSKWIPWIVLIATPIFLYLALNVKFNSDMEKLNYMDDRTRKAQALLESINKASLSTSYVVSRRENMEDALRQMEDALPEIQRMKESGLIRKYSSPVGFIVSDSLQSVRTLRWSEYWTNDKRQEVIALFNGIAKELKYSEAVLNNFRSVVTKNYEPLDPTTTQKIRTAFFDDYIIDKEGTTAIIALVNVAPDRKQEVYLNLADSPVDVFDRQMLTNLFVEYVHADFNFIVTFTASLVFIALFVAYGRIELTLITFAPMFITWIWILGIMALVGIEFNIVNVMVSTFIFGLGDDYSIFIMDGLQQSYRTGRQNLPSIRTAILLSALTTIAGLGVLIFAKHPALRSIAAISIIGIGCVFLMAQTIEPFLFRWLVTQRVDQGKPPMTWIGLMRTLLVYSLFVIGAVGLTAIGLLLRTIPVWRPQLTLCFHWLLSKLTRAVVYFGPNVNMEAIKLADGSFDKPAMIVANHSSVLDILLVTQLHPRLILLTNRWVWNSPIFGGVVRLAQYYPVMDGAEEGIEALRRRVEEGYSIVVFPEGKRSADGVIKRFHKGAFYIAERLALPIRPLLIHGASQVIPKGTLYVNRGQLTLKFLPAIAPSDERFGVTYAERTKGVSRYFKEEFAKFARENETPAYFAPTLVASYLYKGPILEWYLRIKIRLEGYYQVFHANLPKGGSILDLGCGYGFLCFMLHNLSFSRRLLGVDYDGEKIATANHNYLKKDRISFQRDDVTQMDLGRHDAIIMSDVLHYLLPDEQDRLLKRCFEALNPGGRLLVRDGNIDKVSKHQGTLLTEFFSVRLLGFNKSVNRLTFVSGDHLEQVAGSCGFVMREIADSRYTSNTIFIFERTTGRA